MNRIMRTFSKSASIMLTLLKVKACEEDFARDMKTISGRNDHRLFEFMLKRYDPSLDLSYCQSSTHKEFIHEGSGSGTIKRYRNITNGNVRYFEKIFWQDAEELRSINDFYRSNSEWTYHHDIKSPCLLHVIKGEKLTVILYEYLLLNPLEKGNEYRALKSSTLAIAKHPPKTYSPERIRLNLVVEGEEYLSKMGVFSDDEIIKVKKITENWPVYFQHLDLSAKNVFSDSIVIDWDHSGHYHIGPDLGKLLFNYYIFHNIDFLSCYREEIQSYYHNLNIGGEFDDFKLIVLYYFSVYFKGHYPPYEDPVIFPDVIREFRALI